VIIKTDRLDLIAGTLELAVAELENRNQFARLLGSHVPENWPPPLNDTNSMNWFKRYLEDNLDGAGWVNWYFVLRRGETGHPVVVGNGGFKGKPAADGTVEIGYSILEQFQRSGFASEAVRHLVKWAFSHPAVSRVIAETYPSLKPSIGVMEKNGFVFIGDGSESGVIRYELKRTAFVIENV
jgi:[ribosomal protein S5]-alanine N-acetyltransferase